MSELPEDAAEVATRARQDVALRRRLRGDIYKRSAFHRGRLDRVGLGKKGIASVEDLARLPPMGLDDVRAPGDLLLLPRPSKHPKFGALRWVLHDGVSLAYSATDLRLLGKLGADVLSRAGVGADDVVVDLTDGSVTRDQLQIRLGARRAGIPLLSVGNEHSDAHVSKVDASVLVGNATAVSASLKTIADLGVSTRLHTVVVFGELPNPETQSRTEKRLTALAETSGIAVVRMWAPAGVLGAWSQCRGGTGLHTWPESEVVEIVDAASGQSVPKTVAGDLLWTGTGWHASAVIRLATSAFGTMVSNRCPSCGRVAPRFLPGSEKTSFCDALDADPDIASWAAELNRTSRGDELSIWVVPADGASSLSVISSMSDHLIDSRVHIVDQSEVDRIVEAASGERYGDRRAFATEPAERRD